MNTTARKVPWGRPGSGGACTSGASEEGLGEGVSCSFFKLGVGDATTPAFSEIVG